MFWLRLAKSSAACVFLMSAGGHNMKYFIHTKATNETHWKCIAVDYRAPFGTFKSKYEKKIPPQNLYIFPDMELSSLIFFLNHPL